MKPKKSFKLLGTAIGMALWGSLAYLFYPGWPVWIFGGLLITTTLMFLRQAVTSP